MAANITARSSAAAAAEGAADAADSAAAASGQERICPECNRHRSEARAERARSGLLEAEVVSLKAQCAEFQQSAGQAFKRPCAEMEQPVWVAAQDATPAGYKVIVRGLPSSWPNSGFLLPWFGDFGIDPDHCQTAALSPCYEVLLTFQELRAARRAKEALDGSRPRERSRSSTSDSEPRAQDGGRGPVRAQFWAPAAP